MNLMLVNVLDEITGKTDISIIESILQGERNAYRLASLRDRRVKKSEDEIAEALNGNYKDEQLFLLETNYETDKFFSKQLEKLDGQITDLLKEFPVNQTIPSGADTPSKSTQKRGKSRGKDDLRTKENMDGMLLKTAGVDLASITGLQANTRLQIGTGPTDKNKLFLSINRINVGNWFKEQFDRLTQPIQVKQKQKKSRGVRF